MRIVKGTCRVLAVKPEGNKYISNAMSRLGNNMDIRIEYG
jgi:hypothetical protein